MEQLLEKLRILLANNIALKFKSQGYHWNVEGDDFTQYHELFSDVYEDYEGVTDTYAEWLRMLKQYAPYRLTDFFDMATISEPVLVGDPQPMLLDLYESIEEHIEDLKEASSLANQNRENGLMDFLAARQTASQRFCWMLRVSIEKEYIEGMD